ncbi:helix-turn-helix domain-containing protein [Pseudomonas fluorescens]|uniref:helix-turn-helix domain-containing protein n=1 Tax=Pseudomonas fluorescens TaxID=294 RepID=UPI00124136E4|nr:helix-turn-helix domain-containing protein [Pseudomonas fluorescens]VVN47590.1 hypothetical protein PS676_05901 [Pseudomonas fluorescens]
MSNTLLLSVAQLDGMSARISANADQWLERKLKPIKPKKPKVGKIIRRPPKAIANPFAGHLTHNLGRDYPEFAMDIIEGIARLDWHNRGIGQGGISKPLSVRRIIKVLEWLPEITNEAVEDFLDLEERHARRYVKAAELAIPRMMECRPDSLRYDMDRVESPRPCQWKDLDNLNTPSSEELAKLHHDLRTLTEYATAEEYERDDDPSHDVAALTIRKQHPKRGEVMALLKQDVPKLQIERATGVQRKTITKWQAEALAMAA